MYEYIMIGIIAIITFLTRALPFLIFKDKSNSFIEYLGEVLPYAIMAMLVVYCLKDISLLTGNHGICEIIGVFSVIIIFLYKRKRIRELLSFFCNFKIL